AGTILDGGSLNRCTYLIPGLRESFIFLCRVKGMRLARRGCWRVRNADASTVSQSAQVCACNRYRMRQRGGNTAATTERFVEQPELTEDAPAIVVDALARELVVRVEGKHAAKRELDAASRRRQASPCAEMSAPYDDFHHDTRGRNMTLLDLDRQVRERV